MISRLVIASLLLSGPLTARTFTDSSGRKIEAEIMGKDAINVRLKRADGEQFSLPISKFSTEDQQFIQAWQAPAVPAPAAAPTDPSKGSKPLSVKQIESVWESVVYGLGSGDISRLTYIWKITPALSVESSDETHKTEASAIFGDLCQTAGLRAPDGSCPLALHIGTSRELGKKVSEINREKKLPTTSLQDGHSFTVWFDEEGYATDAVVMISTDHFKGEALKPALLQVLLNVLGFPGRRGDLDQAALTKGGKPSPELTEIDRKLIAFLYANVPTRTKPNDLKKIVREKWPQ
ncbi:MAG: hypothetical protein JNJ83_08280 [Verrucomicrobiaceae bacterium]|nr:hypothetical protein [Verrucomicrobiaceae bacterium]